MVIKSDASVRSWQAHEVIRVGSAWWSYRAGCC